VVKQVFDFSLILVEFKVLNVSSVPPPPLNQCDGDCNHSLSLSATNWCACQFTAVIAICGGGVSQVTNTELQGICQFCTPSNGSFNFFLNLHSAGWSPNWVHSAGRPLTGLLYLPRVIVRMENLVEWMAGETEVLGKNLPRRHFVHHKSHLTRPGIKPGPPRWEASD
jgi:hypothetical protein